jgi:hypothetical protein
MEEPITASCMLLFPTEPTNQKREETCTNLRSILEPVKRRERTLGGYYRQSS